MLKNIKKLVLIAAFFSTGLAQSNLSCVAAEFTIHPTFAHEENRAWMILKATPGETIQDSITVKNLSAEKITLHIAVHEADTKNGNIKIIESQNFENIGSWISVQNKIDLLPNETKNLPVNINIPIDTPAKQYTASILASLTETNQQNLQIVTRIGVRIYLDVTNQTTGDMQTSIFRLTANPFLILGILLSVTGIIVGIVINIPFHKPDHDQK